jgi:disulfide bond formation protein DsbB
MKTSPWTFVFGAWLIAAAATLGALFLSEVMGHAPCVLCWYQRIFMFPLVFVLAAGLFPFDPRLVRYALPLAFVGLWVAAFHALVQASYIPESLTPCRQGIPCGVVQVEWLGFVTIPLLSFLGFLANNVLLIAAYLKSKK